MVLGATLAVAIARAAPPAAKYAFAIAAGLGVTAAYISFIDWLGGYKGVYIERFSPSGPFLIWHN